MEDFIDFEAGDVVALNSGSDAMTVVDVVDEDTVRVAMAASFGGLQFLELPVAALTHVEFEDEGDDE